MPATYAPNTAITVAKTMIRQMPVDSTDIKYRIMDDAQKMIWNAAPWQWTIGSLTNVALFSNFADYTIASFPSDFVRFYKAYVTDGQQIQHLYPSTISPTTALLPGLPTQISYISPTPNQVRLFPTPGQLTGNWYLISQYKKASPVISAGNEGTAGALVMPDEYYPVYQSWVMYFALLYAYDTRAGAAQFDPQSGRVAYTGYLATANAFLEEMRRRENLPPEWDYRPDVRADKK